MHFAEEDDCGFYVNRKTGESTWDVPWENDAAAVEDGGAGECIFPLHFVRTLFAV